MRIYCSHTLKTFTKSSNYYQCHLCFSGWYGVDATPLVIIGQTDPGEVNPKYLDNLVPRDLSLRKFTRCVICKDLLGKREHVWCNIQLKVKMLYRQVIAMPRPRLIAIGLLLGLLIISGYIYILYRISH